MDTIDFTNSKSEWFCEYSDLPLKDQRWIWENIPHTRNNKENKEIVSVNRNVIDTCKNEVNTELTVNKNDVIVELQVCTHKTPPYKVASLLDQLFSGWGTIVGHWLYVAQHWNPRAINRTISQMVKQHQRGDEVIQNPAAYFTRLIKFRKQRKKFTSTNDTRGKPQ